MAQSSNKDKKDQKQVDIVDISDILECLQTTRAILLALNPTDTHSATQFAKDITMMVTDLLLRVVHQIGQTNVCTPSLESVIAYIRSLMDTKSGLMRQTIPGTLLNAWYDLSKLSSFIHSEPELRVTNKKAKQLVDVAFETANWAHKQLTAEALNCDQIVFKDRGSMQYTNE